MSLINDTMRFYQGIAIGAEKCWNSYLARVNDDLSTAGDVLSQGKRWVDSIRDPRQWNSQAMVKNYQKSAVQIYALRSVRTALRSMDKHLNDQIATTLDLLEHYRHLYHDDFRSATHSKWSRAALRCLENEKRLN